MESIAVNRYREIWISDVHLGTRGCKAEFLLDFLRHNESEYLYLVGDIIDCWRLRRSWFWAQSHNDFVQKVLRKARKGTRVVADGRRFLILHGDSFDGVVRYARWLAFLGDRAYHILLAVNHWYNITRRWFGYPYWSLSAHLKQRVKNAVEYISNFEQAVAEEAKRRRRHLRPHPQVRDAADRRHPSTATTATGWKAAPPSSSTGTAASN